MSQRFGVAGSNELISESSSGRAPSPWERMGTAHFLNGVRIFHVVPSNRMKAALMAASEKKSGDT